MRIETTRFGPMEFAEEELYSATDGLPGLSGRIFAVVAPRGLSAPFWLQSVQEPGRALLLVDPKHLAPGYAPAPGAVTEALGEPADRLLLRAVAWPAEEEGKLYANLFAPIWVAPGPRRLAQTPMVGSGHELRACFAIP